MAAGTEATANHRMTRALLLYQVNITTIAISCPRHGARHFANTVPAESHLQLPTTLTYACGYCSHFTDEETETQRGYVTCPRSNRARAQTGPDVGRFSSSFPSYL